MHSRPQARRTPLLALLLLLGGGGGAAAADTRIASAGTELPKSKQLRKKCSKKKNCISESEKDPSWQRQHRVICPRPMSTQGKHYQSMHKELAKNTYPYCWCM